MEGGNGQQAEPHLLLQSSGSMATAFGSRNTDALLAYLWVNGRQDIPAILQMHRDEK